MTLTIKRPEKVVPLCLDASLQAEWERAEADLVQARKAPATDRMTGNADLTRLAERVQELERAMLAEVVHFRLRALPRADWSRILAANPPRPDNADDKTFGANKGAFFDAVIPESIVAVTKGDVPVEFNPDDWSTLADDMTDRQYSDFADAVFILNRGTVSVPFSRAASSVNRASSETSGQPETAA